MKKLFLAVCLVPAACLLGVPADEALFLQPHLSVLADKMAYQAGQELSSDKKNTFEHAVCVNGGAHIAATSQLITKDACTLVGLGAHLGTLATSLKEKGVAIITAPASYDVVFTAGKCSEAEVAASIQAALAKIGSSEDEAVIASALAELQDVTRATFARRGGKLELVTHAKTLTVGEKVWRKNPSGASLEVYHSEEEYLVAIRNAGFICEEIKRPCFFGEVKWKAYNSSVEGIANSLGASYKDHNPFTIYLVKKAAA